MSDTVLMQPSLNVSGLSSSRRLLYEEAIRLLPSLETVERGARLGDDIPLIAQNVVRNEQRKVDFFGLVRVFVRSEPLDQQKFVEQLLVDYLERFERVRLVKEAKEAEAAKAAAAATKARVRSVAKKTREARQLAEPAAVLFHPPGDR